MDFLVTGLPRSGTTWASVWLMDHALCLHDPLATRTPQQLRDWNPDRLWGISDTTVWSLPNDIRSFCCPSVVIERDFEIIRSSQRELGVPLLSDEEIEVFAHCPGVRFEYQALFDKDGAKNIWHYLRPDFPFDAERWELLRQIKAEPDFGMIRHDPKIIAQVMLQIRRAAEIAFG